MEAGKEHSISNERAIEYNISNYLVEDFIKVAKDNLRIPKYHIKRKWTIDQKSCYIEQLILKGSYDPIVLYEPIAMYEKDYKDKEVIDGVERIKAIIGFYANKFALSKTKISEELLGVEFRSLGWNLQNRFIYNLVYVYIINCKLSKERRIDLMNRLNSDED